MGTTKSVLVVEDQQDAREMLGEWLSFCGFVVHRAGDGFEALAIAQREHPCVILMDLMMPRMDGWEATRRLKADAGTRDSIVIAVSAHSHRDEQEKARRAGCDDFIAKPYDIERLVDLVRQRLR